MNASDIQRVQPLLDYFARHIQLSSDEQQAIAARLTHRRYQKGQFIVQQGDVCKTENFITSGCVRTYFVDAEGTEHIVMFAIENWWTSDLGSFTTQTPADYNLQCLEDTQVIQITFEVLESLYADFPKLERFFRIILQKAYVASEKRILRNFSLPAKERYLLFRKHYPLIEQRVPQYMIASYLGITKEFLSKIRNQMLTEG